MITERKKRVIGALHSALEYCGYDLDAIMATRCRTRTLSDLRAIIWTIYEEEIRCTHSEAGADFGWDRTTVFSAVKKALLLRGRDQGFTDEYDTVHGAYMSFLESGKSDEGQTM